MIQAARIGAIASAAAVARATENRLRGSSFRLTHKFWRAVVAPFRSHDASPRRRAHLLASCICFFRRMHFLANLIYFFMRVENVSFIGNSAARLSI